MNFLTYGKRVDKIFKNERATAVFKPCEIVFAIVNLLDAKKALSEEEYFFVSVVFEVFKMAKKKLRLSQSGFVGLCNDMIAHFDLVAPYYQFCGDSKTGIMMMAEEDDKYEYRQRAKALLKRKAIFREEWMELHEEFMERFHSFS